MATVQTNPMEGVLQTKEDGHVVLTAKLDLRHVQPRKF